MVASWLGCFSFCAVLIVKRPGGWHTELLVWGLAVGLLAVLYFSFSVRLIARFFEVSDDEIAEALHRRRSSVQQKVSYGSAFVMGMTCGVISATTGIVWFDVGFTAFFSSTVLLTFLKARSIRDGQRRRKERSTGD